MIHCATCLTFVAKTLPLSSPCHACPTGMLWDVGCWFWCAAGDGPAGRARTRGGVVAHASTDCRLGHSVLGRAAAAAPLVRPARCGSASHATLDLAFVEGNVRAPTSVSDGARRSVAGGVGGVGEGAGELQWWCDQHAGLFLSRRGDDVQLRPLLRAAPHAARPPAHHPPRVFPYLVRRGDRSCLLWPASRSRFFVSPDTALVDSVYRCRLRILTELAPN